MRLILVAANWLEVFGVLMGCCVSAPFVATAWLLRNVRIDIIEFLREKDIVDETHKS